VIVIDTNIASVLLSPNHPDLPLILSWQQTMSDTDFRVTAVTRAEIAYGVAIMPDGARKDRLRKAVEAFWAITQDLVLPFGSAAADAYGDIMARRKAAGRPIAVLDAQIASIAKVAGAMVATRNVHDFLDCGIPVVNPYL